MTDAKRPLSVRLPLVIYQKLESQSEETGLSLTEVVISLLGAGVGEDVPRCVEFANTAAALSVTRPGTATAMARRAEIEAALAGGR